MIAIAGALAVSLLLQPAIVIDDFESVSQWKAIPSDDVSLTVGQDTGVHGKSIRLDFDFHGHGGYAVIHRDVKVLLPANYEFSFSIRGNSPVNTLEFKLVDPSGDNVWWSNQPGYVFPADWKTVSRKKRHITFAWGPLGGGDMKEVAGIEIAITAGTGGKGTVWLDDLVMTPLEPATEYNLVPKIAKTPRTVDVDFLKRREFGGLVVDWMPDHRPASYDVATSLDGKAWNRLYSVGTSSVNRDYLYLPETDARFVRLTLSESGGILSDIAVKPLEWSASQNDFFSAVAADALPGTYPRYFSNRQSYWTVIGVNGDAREGMIDEQGVIETGKGQFSIEPFIVAGGRLITWNDASRSTGAVGGDLPIPFVTWKTPAIEMTVTGFADGPPERSVLYARYALHNPGTTPAKATFHTAIRPFQVNPPWQFLNTRGGFAPIDSISFDGSVVHVNGNRRVVPLTRASRFGAMGFDEGNIIATLAGSGTSHSTSARDPLGRASGILSWEISLAPGADTTIDVAIPLHDKGEPCTGNGCAARALASTAASWREKINRVAITLPPQEERLASSIRANLAWILINRDGPAIQPGSRSYERSWIRDGALTSTALLRLGQYGEVREFIDWYSRFQFENGKIPCCVDGRGADPVPENDSHGEFIYLVAEYYRHTGDRALLERVWPNVAKAHAFMDSLRHSRMTPEYQAADKRVFYGLMPQSISHEGYSAKPMHSYWDDFFALRGFKDAAVIAAELRKPETTSYAKARDDFRKDFYASIKLAMSQHKIDFIPGAAELGDFDATSTTIALSPGDELAHVPQPALNRTFEKYFENFRNRRDSAVWEIYTPYEWRTVGTFVRLGQKARAHEVANFFMDHQRPKAWHHWAEVVWRDSLAPKFIGDMPHTWVGSDFIRSTLDMFAYERESDSSIVVGAGIPEAWLRDGAVGIAGLSTHYGKLDYSARSKGKTHEISVRGTLRIPKGGIVVRPIADRPARAARINGRRVKTAGEVVLRSLPAVVSFEY